MESYDQLSNMRKIDEEHLPQIISEQFEEIDVIKKQIKIAREKAEVAKEKSENLHKVGKLGGGKKLAIEDLQESSKMMAEAQEQSAIAQGLFWDYQEKLAKATKWLFGICVNNAANTQTVIRQLQIYMENGNADELDELKQREIEAVIDQLLQQESMQQKQEKMWEQIDSMDEDLAEKKEKDENQDKEIERQAAKDEELGKRIDASEEKDKNQDKEIARQAAKDEELAKMIKQLMESNHEKETQIKELKAICDSLSKRISNNESIVNCKEKSFLEGLDEKASRGAVVVSYIIGVIGIITALVQIFI